MRRRGVPPAAMRDFCRRIGLAKKNAIIDVGQLEFSIRDELNRVAPRRHGGAQAAEARDREVGGEPRRGDGRGQQSGDPAAGTRESAVRARAVDRAGRLPRGTRRRSSSGSSPAARSGCATATSSKCTGVVNDAGEVVEVRYAHDRTRRAACRRRPRKVKGTITGCRRRTRCRRKFACTTACSAGNRGGRIVPRRPQPGLAGDDRGRARRPSVMAAADGQPLSSSSVSATSPSTPTRRRQSRSSTHRHAARHLGEDQRSPRSPRGRAGEARDERGFRPEPLWRSSSQRRRRTAAPDGAPRRAGGARPP